MKLGFSRQIFEKASNIELHWNASSMGAELFHADGQTEMTKLIVPFRKFANAPKTWRVDKGLFVPKVRKHASESVENCVL
jgi:hypothetical protein